MTPNTPDDAVPRDTDGAPPVRRRKQLVEPLVLLAFVVGWFVLQIWVLPKLGVRT